MQGLHFNHIHPRLPTNIHVEGHGWVAVVQPFGGRILIQPLLGSGAPARRREKPCAMVM